MKTTPLKPIHNLVSMVEHDNQKNDKCSTFGIKKVWTKSVQYLPKLLIKNGLIPTIQIGESFKYIGRFFDFHMSDQELPWFQRFIFIIFIAKGRVKINLWLKVAIDSSSRANQFELGSDPDSVS
jgi:hypothetical protein